MKTGWWKPSCCYEQSFECLEPFGTVLLRTWAASISSVTTKPATHHSSPLGSSVSWKLMDLCYVGCCSENSSKDGRWLKVNHCFHYLWKYWFAETCWFPTQNTDGQCVLTLHVSLLCSNCLSLLSGVPLSHLRTRSTASLTCLEQQIHSRGTVQSSVASNLPFVTCFLITWQTCQNNQFDNMHWLLPDEVSKNLLWSGW